MSCLLRGLQGHYNDYVLRTIITAGESIDFERISSDLFKLERMSKRDEQQRAPSARMKKLRRGQQYKRS